MSASPLYYGPPPLWLKAHIQGLATFCSADYQRTAVMDPPPVSRDEGQDLVNRLRPHADLVTVLVTTDDHDLLQQVVVAGFEPFSRVATPDGDRFLFYAETTPSSYVWPDLEAPQPSAAA